MKVGPTATKKSVLEELLEQGMVLVALDARVEGVDVPSHLHRDPQLRLNLSYRFGLPMDVGEWGVNATLTFAGVPFECRIPWRAIFLLVSHVSGQPYLFPDDIPAELLSSGEGAEGLQRATKLEPARPKLTLVTRDASADGDGDGDTDDGDNRDDAQHAQGDGDTAGHHADAADGAGSHAPHAVESGISTQPGSPVETASATAPAPDAAASSYGGSTPSVDVPVVDNDGPKNPRRPRGRGHLRLVK